uniref:Uncharacterized protein n=1 Tax=Rhizophagus irregularis (strain DAOM 181602 / DAOM 197198 / MUCL 43194) TaxID=747089 RepID=U9TGD0_RHIID
MEPFRGPLYTFKIILIVIGWKRYVSGKCIKYALPYIFQLKNWSLDRLDGTRYS